MSKSKKNKKSSGILPLLFMLIVGIAIGYFVVNKPSSEETYVIKGATSENGYRESFINLTGRDAKDKKIHLSDDYWTGGKFQ